MEYFQNKVSSTNFLEINKILTKFSNEEMKDIVQFLIDNDKNMIILKNKEFKNLIKLNFNLYENKNMNFNFVNEISKILKLIYDYNYKLLNNNLHIIDNDYNLINTELVEKGIYINKNLLNIDYCDNLLKIFNNKIYIDRNDNMKNHKLNIYDIDFFKNKSLWVKNQSEIINNIYIKNIVTDNYIYNIVKNYLNADPILCQVNFWINGESKINSSQVFHQDRDHLRFLKIFIYLNDVNENNGAHIYVEKSKNNIKMETNNYKPGIRVSDNFINLNYKDNIKIIEGKKGSIIFEDTTGFHKGGVVKTNFRYLLQIEYCISTRYIMEHSGPILNLDKNIYKDVYEKFPNLFLFCKLV